MPQKVKIKCPKCKGTWEDENVSPYAFGSDGKSFKEMKCPKCGAWEKMERKY
jgi:phage FluMu protein Com